MKTQLGLRFVAVASSVSIMAALTAGGTAAAPPTLDQEQAISTYPSEFTVDLAQTFTAGITGDLAAVSIYRGADIPSVVVAPNDVGETTLSIYSVVNGKPDNGLSATLLTMSDVGWNIFNFFSPMPMQAGTQYAIVVHNAVDGNHWYGDCTDDYTAGQALIWQAPQWITGAQAGQCLKDFAFRTYVQVAAATPTPTPTPTPTATPAPTPTATPAPTPTPTPTQATTPPPTSGTGSDGRDNPLPVGLLAAGLVGLAGVALVAKRWSTARR